MITNHSRNGTDTISHPVFLGRVRRPHLALSHPAGFVVVIATLGVLQAAMVCPNAGTAVLQSSAGYLRLALEAARTGRSCSIDSVVAALFHSWFILGSVALGLLLALCIL